MNLADEYEEEIAEMLTEVEYETRADLDEAVHDYLEEDLMGFFGASKRFLNGIVFFDVVEFTLTDGSSIVIAEDHEGDVSLFTADGSPSFLRH